MNCISIIWIVLFVKNLEPAPYSENVFLTNHFLLCIISKSVISSRFVKSNFVSGESGVRKLKDLYILFKIAEFVIIICATTN